MNKLSTSDRELLNAIGRILDQLTRLEDRTENNGVQLKVRMLLLEADEVLSKAYNLLLG